MQIWPKTHCEYWIQECLQRLRNIKRASISGGLSPKAILAPQAKTQDTKY